MTALVTGASGFIGSHLVKQLLDGGEEVIALLHHTRWSKWLKEALSGAIIVYGDIREYHMLMNILNQYTPDEVYHLAALSIVKTAHRDPINTFDINVMGTVKLLEACRQTEVPKILIQSSDKVYGDLEFATGSDPLCSSEPYGTSKTAADMIAQTFADTYDMEIAIVRPCNIYGFDWNDRIIPNTIRSCLLGQDPVIYNNGGDKRQYLYVEDLCNALLTIMEKDRGLRIHNIGPEADGILGQEEVVLKILEHFPDRKPQYVDRSEIREIRSQSLILSLRGWNPKYSFEEGIRETIERFQVYGF